MLSLLFPPCEQKVITEDPVQWLPLPSPLSWLLHKAASLQWCHSTHPPALSCHHGFASMVTQHFQAFLCTGIIWVACEERLSKRLGRDPRARSVNKVPRWFWWRESVGKREHPGRNTIVFVFAALTPSLSTVPQTQQVLNTCLLLWGEGAV